MAVISVKQTFSSRGNSATYKGTSSTTQWTDSYLVEVDDPAQTSRTEILQADVRRVLSKGPPNSGDDHRYYEMGDSEFWAKITSSTASGSTYKYEWTEAVRTEGGFQELTGARTGTIDDDTYALAHYEQAGMIYGRAITTGTYVLLRVSGDNNNASRFTIVSFHLLTPRSKFMVLQTMDDSGTWDLDYIKGH